MIQIAICDDDSVGLSRSETLILEYAEGDAGRFHTALFKTPESLLEAVHTRGPFDIYLLDIIMPGINGVELGDRLREMDAEGTIIYLTATEDYALQAYNVFPLQYLLKPVDRAALFNTLDRAIRLIDARRQQDEKFFSVKTTEGVVSLPFHTICGAELNGHTIVLHLSGGRTVKSSSIRVSFDEVIAPLLADARFIRPHKSYVLNLHAIRRLTPQAVEMAEGQIVPVSRRYAAEVKQRYVAFAAGVAQPSGHLPVAAGKIK